MLNIMSYIILNIISSLNIIFAESNTLKIVLKCHLLLCTKDVNGRLFPKEYEKKIFELNYNFSNSFLHCFMQINPNDIQIFL